MTQPVVPEQSAASPEQVREMKETIKRVRETIAKFHTLRRKNNERAAGLRPAMVPPQQVQQVLRQNRNPQAESRAVEQLRQFLTVLRGHEPSQQEMQEGIPEGFEETMSSMGFIPIPLALVLTSVGASVVTGFMYLIEVEQTNQQMTATPVERLLSAVSDNIWAVAAVGAVGVGGFYYWNSRREEQEEREHELEKIKVMGEAMSRGSREDDEEKPGLVDKVKGIVQNGLFPPEKNPSLSPAERLAAQIGRLEENEQEKLFAIVRGEEVEEDDEPEEEIDEVEVEEADDEEANED